MLIACGEGERFLTGDSDLRRGGVSPRLTGDGSAHRLGEGSGGHLGDSSLRFGDLFHGGEAGSLCGEAERDMHVSNYTIKDTNSRTNSRSEQK
jgi:hypothetical protein